MCVESVPMGIVVGVVLVSVLFFSNLILMFDVFFLFTLLCLSPFVCLQLCV